VIHDQGVAGADRPRFLSSSNTSRTLALRHGSLPPQPCGRVPRVRETPFNSPRRATTRYHVGVLGFPQVIYTGIGPQGLPATGQAKRRGWLPEDYLPWVRSPAGPAHRARRPPAMPAWDYLSKVPTGSIGR